MEIYLSTGFLTHFSFFLFFKTKGNLSSKYFPGPFKGVFSCNADYMKSYCIIKYYNTLC